MKAILETISDISPNRDIDASDTPISILCKFYKDDATAVTQIFSNQKAIEQLMDGHIDETKNAFELINIHANWKTALCNQPSIKDEMERIESEGLVPTFVVFVYSIVSNSDGAYTKS